MRYASRVIYQYFTILHKLKKNKLLQHSGKMTKNRILNLRSSNARQKYGNDSFNRVTGTSN